MVEGPRPARSQNQQQAARCQRHRLFVCSSEWRWSEWRCGLKAASHSEAPGFQAAKGQTRPDQRYTSESSACKVLVGRGARCATIVAAAVASAEPWSPPEGTTKNRSESRTSIDGGDGADTRATNLPKEAERSSILLRGPCARKSRKSEDVKVSPSKTALSVRGTSPLKPTPGVGEERVRSPQARMGKIRPSWTGVRLLYVT